MIKDVTKTFPVLAFLTIRFGLAAGSLLPFVAWMRRWPTHAEWRWGVASGLAFCSGYICQTFSLRLVDSGRTGFITGLYVILVPMLALVMLRHRLSWRAIAGAVLAVVGLALLSNAPGGNLTGDMLAFLGALSFAAQIIVVEKFPLQVDWRIMSMITALTVSVISALLFVSLAAVRDCQLAICTPFVPFAEPPPTTLPLAVIGVAAFTGVVATALGLLIQVWAQRLLPPTDAAIIFSLEAPFAAVSGFLFRGETLSTGGIVGCVLMLGGMLVTSIGSPDVVEGLSKPHEV